MLDFPRCVGQYSKDDFKEHRAMMRYSVSGRKHPAVVFGFRCSGDAAYSKLGTQQIHCVLLSPMEASAFVSKDGRTKQLVIILFRDLIVA